MPIDPQIPLDVKPIPIADPLEQTARVLAIKNAVQQGQMGALDLQQKQIQLDQTRALNKAYTDALIVDPTTGKATIDSNGLTKALAMGGHGNAIPGVLSSVAKSQRAISDLRESQLKVSNLEQDAAGAVGNATLAANGDPHLFLTQLNHAVQAGAMKPEQAAPLIDHLNGLLATDAQDTTGASQTARDFASQTARQLVASSEKYQQLATSAKSAEGSYMRGQAAQENAERQVEAAGTIAEEKARTDAGKMRSDTFAQARSIATSGDAQAYKQFVDAQPAIIQGELYHVADPRRFDAQKTPQALDQAMLTPQAREQARATAARVAQAELDRKKAQEQRDRALGFQEERLNKDSKQTKNSEAIDRRNAEGELLKLHLREGVLNAQRRRLGDALKANGPDATITDSHGNAVSAAGQLEDVTNEYKELVADKYNAFTRTGRGAPSVSYDEAVRAIDAGMTPATPAPATANTPAAPAPEPTPKPAPTPAPPAKPAAQPTPPKTVSAPSAPTQVKPDTALHDSLAKAGKSVVGYDSSDGKPLITVKGKQYKVTAIDKNGNVQAVPGSWNMKQ